MSFFRCVPLLWVGFTAGLICALAQPRAARADGPDWSAATAAVGEQVREWRRDLHQHPELGNRETRTAQRVATELQAMGLKVQTGVAHTGVVALIEGRSARPLIALRADMDALPVTEQTGLPFASKVTTTYRGETVGVMHACGHDAHVAILLGAAKILTEHRDQLPGSVLLIFQPAEEGPPEGEEGGAELMLKEGVFAGERKPDAIVGLHVFSTLRAGQVGLRGGPIMAESDSFTIKIKGVQAHGSRPWSGVDPILTAARIVDGLQSIVSRRLDLTAAPAVVSIGAIKSGIRYNIIPEDAELLGTIRSFDDESREFIYREIEQIATHTALAHGATATVSFTRPSRVTNNDRALAERLRPALERAVGAEQVIDMPLLTIAEDFAFFANEVPGFYFFVGSTAAESDPRTAPGNHSPRFLLDEAALQVGVRSLLEVSSELLRD
jgi:amidohydrolase